MKSVWENNKMTLWLFFAMVVGLLAITVIYEKADIHIFINRHHNAFFDVFFKFSTHMGHGTFVVIVSLLLLFWKIRYTLYSLSVYIFGGFFVQLMKRIIWPTAPRPSIFFDEGTLHIVEGIKMYKLHSFPSGHTASVFGLFFALMLLVKDKRLKWLFFILAWITGFSRIYLSQHFMEDVIVGSLIGVLSALFLYWLFSRFKASWLDKSVLKTNDKKS